MCLEVCTVFLEEASRRIVFKAKMRVSLLFHTDQGRVAAVGLTCRYLGTVTACRTALHSWKLLRGRWEEKLQASEI